MPRVIEADGALEVHLRDGTIISITEYLHMSNVTVSKGQATVKLTLGKGSNNAVQVETTAPFKI